MLPVLEGEAFVLNDAVGVALTVVLADAVVLGVPDGVLVLVPVPTPEGVAVGVADAV